MYSTIGRWGFIECETVICGGLLGCFSGTVKTSPCSFLSFSLIDKAGAGLSVFYPHLQYLALSMYAMKSVYPRLTEGSETTVCLFVF